MRNNLQLKGNTDYSKPSSTRRHILHDKNGFIYFSDVLSVGNSKLSKDILIFDLLAGDTCLNCKDCIKTCYAMKAQRQYPDVYNKRAINTWLANNTLLMLQSAIHQQLQRSKKKYVRIHSSGDFINQKYIDIWASIATCNPTKQFYYYTKVDNMFDFNKLNSLPNVNQVVSILPDGSINYGSDTYVQEKSKEWNIPVCPYGYEEDVICGETCKLCLRSRYILFKQH